jgi:translation elongation factor EF-1beta
VSGDNITVKLALGVGQDAITVSLAALSVSGVSQDAIAFGLAALSVSGVGQDANRCWSRCTLSVALEKNFLEN